MNEIVVAVLSSSVLASLISGIFQYINNKKNKQDKMEVGIRLLLLATIRQEGDRLCQKGKISRDEYHAFFASYDAYKALGGDGWADGVRDKINMLERDFTD